MPFLRFPAQAALARLAIFTFVAASLCLLPAQAQQPPPAAQPQLTSQDVSDEELEQFVDAYEDVEVIRIELGKKMANAQDPNVANQLQQEANKKMVAAVQNNGLDPDRYNALSSAVSTDKQLMGRFQVVRKERAEEQQQ
jgi:hypothetical protein